MPIADPTAIHPAEAAQVEAKYKAEREKRLRPEGLAQFIDLTQPSEFKRFEDDVWANDSRHAAATGAPPALQDGATCKFLVVGAGFGGLCFAVRLVEAGFAADDVRIVDAAGGFGGTWYWNRYPGVMCDVESYIYMPLLEEMGYMPKHKYSYGPELREYTENVAKRWDLADKAMFRTKADSLTWDEDGKEWVAKLTHQRTAGEAQQLTVRAQYAFIAPGVLTAPQLPRLPGIEKFKGHSFHTSRWDYSYTGGSPTDASLTNLKGKRVGIIGTGATAVQAVPHLAKWAEELYVFQRTPSSVDRRDNRATDPTWWSRETQGRKGWQRVRNDNFSAYISNVSPKPSINMVADAWTEYPTYSVVIGGPKQVPPEQIPAHIATLRALDQPIRAKVRERTAALVNDPATATSLTPWYPTWCKRPCFHDEYLAAFNAPNVTLVDTDGRGVEGVTAEGVRANGTLYPLDVLIFGTGFRSPIVGSPAFRAGGMVVTGKRGVTLDQKWDADACTLHGVTSRGFPNLFWSGPSQGAATANFTFVLDQLATHVSYIVAEAERRARGSGHRVTVEPTAVAEGQWMGEILQRAAVFAPMGGCTPSYLNREGELDQLATREEQMKIAAKAIWGHGMLDFVALLEKWRAEGSMQGMEVVA